MSKPELSIVIASCVGSPFIDRCLESFHDQIAGKDIECIVVDRVGGAVAEHIKETFPWVALESRDAKESVPDLRRWGIQQAKADYVAIIEEHCVAKEDWIETILNEISGAAAVVGGVVDDAGYDRLMDWAVYFTEYNSYMPPAEAGKTEDVCAANCVYRRDLLLEHLPDRGSGYWEAGLNHKLLSIGENFRLNPELVVYHTGPFGFFYYLNQRFLFSRAFAGTRREQVSIVYRAAYIILSPLIAPLLWFRTASRVFKKKRRIGKFLLVTPLMVPITGTYVLGECVGFLAGRGNSLEKIE
ncbi:MAG: glycosyltransferase [Acidobacteria bacterium]|nr:MAG: glycosyltransferase [Acidobacteriota bacterium]REK01183.1 MAG: glycosyltransferase [Acidobacteriota bacterium]REK14139.1 MAG: glycosyltransferase [Acidobacteriota bacterium]REK44854.1 MAG: glycosyltransferase [Acidobacteriota bacterium]